MDAKRTAKGLLAGLLVCLLALCALAEDANLSAEFESPVPEAGEVLLGPNGGKPTEQPPAGEEPTERPPEGEESTQTPAEPGPTETPLPTPEPTPTPPEETLPPEFRLPESLTLAVGEVYAIDASALGKGVAYRSSKKSVATVSRAGKVTAVKVGSAKTTVYVNGEVRGSFPVKVMNPPKRVALNRSSLELDVGETFQL